MKGKNPIRRPEKGLGETLAVQEIFATLQGEGPFAGMPATFIRLGGCNLACDFCDTEFESFREMALEDIVTAAKEASAPEQGQVKLIVITGGEPLRQPIALLCARLIEQGFAVQIETNGTLCQELPAEVHWVCSPKNTGTGYHPLRGDVLERADALKFIISASHSLYQHVPDYALESGVPVYLQPMDEGNRQKNAANLARCLSLQSSQGFYLSIQAHKQWGIQ